MSVLVKRQRGDHGPKLVDILLATKGVDFSVANALVGAMHVVDSLELAAALENLLEAHAPSPFLAWFDMLTHAVRRRATDPAVVRFKLLRVFLGVVRHFTPTPALAECIDLLTSDAIGPAEAAARIVASLDDDPFMTPVN